jgi:hypothetical protein
MLALILIKRRDPRESGRTIMLVPADKAACQAWAARQGFQLCVLDRDFPAFSDACRWIWARMSRGLISDDDLAAKLARLRSRIMEADHAVDHSRGTRAVRTGGAAQTLAGGFGHAEPRAVGPHRARPEATQGAAGAVNHSR